MTEPNPTGMTWRPGSGRSADAPDDAPGTPENADLKAIRARIADRFGLVPSFFMMASDEPQIVNTLFGMAEFAYFDSPLPPLFKERLFTYVSRFCGVPYCMARHCGFLLGLGNVSGQRGIEGVDVEQALAMLSEPFPDADARERLAATLRGISDELPDWPEAGSPLENTFFHAAAVAFVMPLRHPALLRELERVLGSTRYNYLMLFLAFVRFAHYWTESHPRLRIESDVEHLLAEQRALAEWIVRYEQIVHAELGEQVRTELQELEAVRMRADALEASESALRREVEVRTRAAEAAEAASLAKSGFMATISHELRTPLNAIIGYVDLLQTGIAGPLGDQARQYVARIKATARHQQQIVEEILTFSRLEAGRETVAIGPVPLSEIRDEIEAIVTPLAAERGLRFTIDLGDAPEILYTDPRKLRQILLNLLGNSVKFTEAGFVSLAARRTADSVAFIVSDSGPGIPPGYRDRLFEPFTQGDESPTRLHGGTGLGLAITKRLVTLLEGAISLESEQGRGTTFTVEIPLHPPEPAPEAQAGDPT